MRKRLLLILAALAAPLLAVGSASAHPHVWVKMVSVLVYAPDGSITGVRHAWTFDDMFSTYAIQGLGQKTKGSFSREELAPLAKVNVNSLKEFDYFTYGKADGQDVKFTDPKDYWLDYKGEMLTLTFTLPLAAPVKAKTLNLEVYDPSYFVDFSFGEQNPVALADAPDGCKATFFRPKDMTVAHGKQLGEAFFNQLNSAENWGAQFANKILVQCP